MTATLNRIDVPDAATGEPAGPELRSAYPADLDDLMPRARSLAARLGTLPSRNRLMRELRIGGPKATALLAELGRQPGDLAERHATEAAVPVPRPQRSRPATQRPVSPPTTTPTPAASAVVAAPIGVRGGRVRSWPVWLLALPAFVAIWSGWVGLGELTGFGTVRPLPGVWDSLAINTAITLPVGMEAYAAFALRVWLSTATPPRARRFARWSAIGALALGAAGQVAYHLMSAAGVTAAPWQITTLVACLPVAVLGMGAALAHLLTDRHNEHDAVEHDAVEHDAVEHDGPEHGERGEVRR